MNQQLLRQIPKVDELLKMPALEALLTEMPAQTVTRAVRRVLEEQRRDVLEGRVEELPAREAICGRIVSLARREAAPSLQRVINGTGIILHTNLGRACLSDKAVQAACSVAGAYSTLEYNLATGGRGLRHTHVEELLCRLTGAESALVVNNNAAAVLLTLSALTAGGQVVVSRGELVEIGGSFRVPDIMEACGARLKEVGTTNKTHLRDYDEAICAETKALMKVHTSNYRIVGFAQTPALEDLVELGHSRDLLVFEDLGSGCLIDLNRFGIHEEPTAQESLRAGVDLVSFSGDKLLGGPQAGIILGKKKYVDILKKHPLARAMRVDKMTLAALEATLRSYEAERTVEEIPTIAMLAVSQEELLAKAETLCAGLKTSGCNARVVATEGQVGGGSVPTQMLKSYAVALEPGNGSVDNLEEKLRLGQPPIIGRIHRDQYLLDVRTLKESDFEEIIRAAAEA